MPDQLSFPFLTPETAYTSPTPIADKLISAGFANNIIHLRYYDALENTDDIPAPSRMYRLPIQYVGPEHFLGEAVYLQHPYLSRLPYVRRIASTIGHEIYYPGIAALGFNFCEYAQWCHAEDLMTEDHWHHLIESRNLTTTKDILKATTAAIRNGTIHIATARTALAHLEIPEPLDLSPRHATHTLPHGIDDGWFHRTRSGFLTLTEKAIKARGLDRDHDAGMEM